MQNWHGVSIDEKWAIFGDQLVIIQKIKKELEDRVGKIVIIFEVISKISKHIYIQIILKVKIHYY